MAKMKIYIAGPITGTDDYAERFAKAEAILTEKGFEPLNPVTLPHNHDKEWASYMKEAIAAMMTCEAVIFLNGWEESAGARVERQLAIQLNFNIFYQ